MRAMRTRYAAGGAVLLFVLTACTPTVRVKHEVEPIHVTVDVYVKVQRELEKFFQFEEELEGSSPASEESPQR
jgi:hypothetical protein